MTLSEIRQRKQELGYSNETLANLSGVPLGTVQKVLGGVTKNPRQKTLEALSAALQSKPGSFTYDYPKEKPAMLKETSVAYSAEKRVYTIEDIYALPDDVWAELIDGRLYYIGFPTRTHQKLAGGMLLLQIIFGPKEENARYIFRRLVYISLQMTAPTFCPI